MSFDSNDPKWKMGDSAQKTYARKIAATGRAALPAYAADDVTPETKAPVMFHVTGRLVTPDVLVFDSTGATEWHEVKAKSAPTFYRKLGRWEHGFDYYLVRHYREVEKATGHPVHIIVFETESPRVCCSKPVAQPVSPRSWRCLECGADGESSLVPSGTYLTISLAEALRLGQQREFWPDGRGGRNGAGGLLFARDDMGAVSFTPPPALPPATPPYSPPALRRLPF